MSSLSQESVVMMTEFLTVKKEDTRVWLQAEMDRLVNPMLDSIFNKLQTKLTNGLERTQSGDGDEQLANLNPNLHDQSVNVQMHQTSTFIPKFSTSSSSFNQTSTHFNQQFVSINHSYHQSNSANHLNSISNQYLSQSQPIKEEIEPMPTSGQSSLYAPVSNEKQSNHNLKYQNFNNIDEWNISQFNSSDTEMQPQQFAHINHNEHDEEKCDCDECADGGKKVKVKNEEKDKGDEESSRLVKRLKLDTIQPNNAIESIANECTTNQIQLNLIQSTRHLQCSNCSKSFDKKFELQRHLRVHTGERPFQCEQCDERFSQLNNLTRHQLIHQNVKKFQCTQCERQFTLKHHLRDHLLIHSGGRPFECRHCEKLFAKSDTRNRHEQAIHLHVKPYRCKQCGLTVTRRATMVTHIRVVHFGLPRTIKEQQTLNIVDNRDPRELLENV